MKPNGMNGMNDANDKTGLLPEFSCPDDYLADTYIFIILQKINYL